MFIECINVHNVRNLTNIVVEPAPGLNVFVGANASGKTAILEAICFLSRARSFRTPKVQHVIQHQASSLTVAAKIRYSRSGLVKTGVEKSRGQTVIHHNGKSIKAVSEQEKNLPLILISPNTNTLAVGTPKQRRHWLDWTMFHVEPSYRDTWRDYHSSLRQRNKLLKSGLVGTREIVSWEQSMANAAERLTEQRVSFIEQVQVRFIEIMQGFFAFKPEIRILKGWSEEKDLNELFEIRSRNG